MEGTLKGQTDKRETILSPYYSITFHTFLASYCSWKTVESIHEKFNARNNNKFRDWGGGEAYKNLEEKENVEVDKEQGARSSKVLEGEERVQGN